MEGINLDGVRKMCRDSRILSMIKSRLSLSIDFYQDGSSELRFTDDRFNEEYNGGVHGADSQA